MHPILFEIPLTLTAFALVGLAIGAVVALRTRFGIETKDSNYLVTFVGLNIQWGEVAAPWSVAIRNGAIWSLGIAALGVVKTFGLPNAGVSPTGGGILTTVMTAKTIPVHVYGVMMVSSFLTAIWLATREATHERLPQVAYLDPKGKQYVDRDGKKVFLQASDLVNDLAFYIIVSGLGGARILYIFTRWNEEYSHDPMRMFKVWEGGLVWYGGLIGATLTSVWFIRKNKVAFLPYGDLIVPGVSIAHAIGRLGCFAAGCCFGNVAIAGFPLAAVFPVGSPAAAAHYDDHLLNSSTLPSLPVYPTQIMEALGEVVIFFILLRVRARKRFHGQVLLTYFFMYAILRTTIEMFRGDKIRAFFFTWPDADHPMLLSTSQGISLIVAVVGIGLTTALIRQRAKLAATAAT